MYSKLGLKLNNEQFDIRISGYSFDRIDDYVNTSTIIRFKCKTCGKIFKKKPKEISKLKCNCDERLNKYKEHIKNKNLIVLDTFLNVRTKIRHKCTVCENIFLSSPKTIKNSIYGCPFCAGSKISNKDYISKLPINIQLIGEYKNTYTKIEHKCLECNNNWFTKPNYILHMGCGCPFCKSSKGEKLITLLLNNIGIQYESEKAIIINSKTYYYDFYIPDIRLAIEFNGIQHYEPVEFFGGEEQFLIIKENDKIKIEWSKKNNITLLQSPYYDMEICELIILENIQILMGK
jgi:hypothetical protein